MEKTNIEILFEWMDEVTEIIQHHDNETYLDSLAITMETLFYEEPSEHFSERISHQI